MSRQGATQYKEAQHIGSAKVLISAYGESTFTDLGIGEGISYAETITSLAGEPDNGEMPDILIGIAKQSAQVLGTLWTQKWDNIKKLRGDIDVKTESTTDGSTVYTTGGKSEQGKIIVRLEQRTRRAATADDVTQYVTDPTTPIFTFAEGDEIIILTTFEFHKCNLIGGENIAPPSDTNTTPIIKYPFTIQAMEDYTRTVGDYLFSRTITVEDPSA